MNLGNQRPLPVIFYRTPTGNEPTREWLRDLPAHERFCIGEDIKRVQYCWPLGLPLVRPMGAGLFEIRSKLPTRDARILFCFSIGNALIIHGFIKKTDKIPLQDLIVARIRQRKTLTANEEKPTSR